MPLRAFTLAGRSINDQARPFVIAEIGHNHQGSLDICKKMFEAARSCGVDAVKLQKRDNKSLYTEAFYNAPYNSENAFGPTYGAHREALEFGVKEYRELQTYAKELGLVFFATAFDMPSADFLRALDMPCYKIASGDIRNIPLLRHIASFNEPMIVSTGGSTLEDIRRAYREVMSLNTQVAFLHCTAMYPIASEHEDKVNLRMIETLRREFPDIVIGFSDHSNGIMFSTVAYALGARIIEKHFTLSRTMKGTDHAFSLEPQGAQKLVAYLNRLHLGMGDGQKRFYEEERPPIRKMAKMIVASRYLPAGTILYPSDLSLKSPADGLDPYHLDMFIGRTLKVALAKDQPLEFGHV